MNPTAEYPCVERRMALHEQVRVPDGRTGRVIGFYRRAEEAVLIGFRSGEAEEFPSAQIETLS